jgi:hypothetical protein
MKPNKSHQEKGIKLKLAIVIIVKRDMRTRPF